MPIVCMSDTHNVTNEIKFDIPDGDIFIHAGDFTKIGQLEEVIEFNSWLGTLSHRYKIVIAGNHELSFDPTYKNMMAKCLSVSSRFPNVKIGTPVNAAIAKKELTNCVYLEDSSIKLFGLNIYGTPWQPGYFNWAFNRKKGKPCLEKWQKIPLDTDILISHSPPVGHGDLTWRGITAGCVDLLNVIQNQLNIQYHIYGHIHEGYGTTSDGKVTYINASTCNTQYQPVNPPIVFDVQLPEGVSKV